MLIRRSEKHGIFWNIKDVGALIWLPEYFFRTCLEVRLMSWLESKSHCSRHPSSLPLAVPLPHILWTKLSVVVMAKRCQTLRRSSQLASFILSPYFQLSVNVDIAFLSWIFPFPIPMAFRDDLARKLGFAWNRINNGDRNMAWHFCPSLNNLAKVQKKPGFSGVSLYLWLTSQWVSDVAFVALLPKLGQRSPSRFVGLFTATAWYDTVGYTLIFRSWSSIYQVYFR